MHKTLKREFDLRLLRLFVAFGVLVLPSVFSYAEDLTTLDGKTFTNITEVTKYPKLVVFTYNSNRTSAAISNLPEDFLAKHGVEVPLHTAANANTQDASLQKDPLAMGQLLKAERDGDIETIKILLKNGADINSKQTPDGATALIWAAVEGHMDMVKLLLDNGADINATNNVGMTALMGAAKVGNIEVVKLLLARGAEGGKAAIVLLQTWLDNASGKSVNAGVASDKPALQSTNPVDIFLANHQDSSLEEKLENYVDIPGVKSSGHCSIRVTAKNFELESFDPIAEESGKLLFNFGEEEALKLAFDKNIEWEDIARKNNTESFEKDIPYSVGNHTFSFNWKKDFPTRAIAWFGFRDEKDGFYRKLEKEQVIKFRKYLDQLPALKQQLMQDIQNQEAQKNLFK